MNSVLIKQEEFTSDMKKEFETTLNNLKTLLDNKNRENEEILYVNKGLETYI